MSEDARIPVPTTVKVAIGVQIIGIVVNYVGLFTRPTYGGLGFGGVVGLIAGVGVGFLILRAIYRGRNWVRVVLTVLAAIGTLLVLVDLVTGFIGYTWLDLIAAVLFDVAIVLLWIPVSQRYFTAVKAPTSVAPN